MKYYILISILTLCGIASAENVFCLTSSSHVKMFASAFRSDFLERSNKLALNDSNVKNIYSFSAKNDSDLVFKIEESFKQGCQVLVGLYTSKECLLGAPIAQKYNRVILSPTCSHDDLMKWKGFVFTMVPSIDEYINETLQYIEKNKKIKKLIVIYQPSDVFSNSSFESFNRKNKNKYLFVRLNKEGDFYSEDLPSLENFEFDSVLILTYPVVGIKAVASLSATVKNKRLITLISSSSWAFDQSVLKTNSSVFDKFRYLIIPEVAPIDVYRQSIFFKNYQKQYNESPFGIHAMSYDATRMALKCYKTYGINFKAESFRRCIIGKSYLGLTGKYNFSVDSPFIKRKIYFEDSKGKLQ